MDLEEKVEKLAERVGELEKENRKLKSKLKNDEKQEDQEISRRKFIKKLGAGAAGIGAMGIASASGLKLTKSGLSSSGSDISLNSSNLNSIQNLNVGSTTSGSLELDGFQTEIKFSDLGDHYIRYDSSGSGNRRLVFEDTNGGSTLLSFNQTNPKRIKLHQATNVAGSDPGTLPSEGWSLYVKNGNLIAEAANGTVVTLASN